MNDRNKIAFLLQFPIGTKGMSKNGIITSVLLPAKADLNMQMVKFKQRQSNGKKGEENWNRV